MRKLKGILLGFVLLLVVVFSSFGGVGQTAHASNFLLSYSQYSEEVQKILNEFCAYKTRIAGSENEEDASKYIHSYLKTNATKLSAKNDAATVDGVQEFMYMSEFSGIYENSQNIVFEYKSASKTDKKVILACNYDAPLKYDEEKGEFVSYENDALNASAAGVASMLMLAQTLPNYSLSYNLEFVFFGASETYNEGSEFYLSRLYSFKKIFNIDFPIVVDSFREGELSTKKESVIIRKFSEFIGNQFIFTATLKDQEKNKYDEFKNLNVLEYECHDTSKILKPEFVSEIKLKLKSLLIDL